MVRVFWACVFVAFLHSSDAGAQALWTEPAPANNITVEGFKPIYTDGQGITLLTSAWYLSGRYAVTPRVQLVGEVGLSHFGQDIVAVNDVVMDEFSETALGNALLGVTYSPPVHGLRVTMAARLPTASGTFGSRTGVVADPYRYEAFIIDYSSVLLDVSYILQINESISLRTAGRPSLHFDHFEGGSGARGGTDVAVRYALQGWYETEQFCGAVGFTGSTSMITGLHLGVRETTAVALGASILGRLGALQPGLTLQIPFTEEYSETLDAIIGLTLVAPLP